LFALKGSYEMFIKKIEQPLEISQMQALERRLSSHHLNKELIISQTKNLKTGYEGEQSLEYLLKFLPTEEYYILHNLRIPDPNGYFQIDFLILSLNFGLIVEVKNIYGTVTFDKFGQA